MNLRHLLTSVAAGGLLAAVVGCSTGTSEAEAHYLDFLERKMGITTMIGAATTAEWVDLGHAICESDRPIGERVSIVAGMRGVDAWDASVTVGAAQAYLCPTRTA